MKSRSQSAAPEVRRATQWLGKHPGTALVYLLVLPVMACLVLLLPPIALPSRIANAGYTPIQKTGVNLHTPDGAELDVPEEAVARGASVKLTTVSLETFLSSEMARGMPSTVQGISPLYQVALQGDAPTASALVVPLPADAEPYETLDLYGYWNQMWFKLPFTLNATEERLESQLNFLPQAFVVVQTVPRAPVISAQIEEPNSLPLEADSVLVQVNPLGLRIADEGSIAGDPVSATQSSSQSNFAVVPTVSNVDENGVRSDLTGNMMVDDAQRSGHINALVDLAVQKVWRGYNIAYQGVGLADEAAYTQFIKELARALHAKEKILSVTLPAPSPVSEDTWDTGGYNWALIGRYADEVKIPLLADPRAFEDEPSLQSQYLRWAVGQIDRSKLQVIASAAGRDSTADQYTPVSFGNALKLTGPIEVPKNLQPGEKVTLDLPGLASAGGIQVHEPSGMFYFNYTDGDERAHTVWLENADSLAKKIKLALNYNIGGVVLQDYDVKGGIDDRVWAVLDNYKTLQPTLVENELALVWSVDGKPAGTSTVRNPKFTWAAPDSPGDHNIQVSLSVDGGLTAGLPQGTTNLKIAAAPTPTPTPEPTEVPEEPTAKPTAKVAANTAPKPTAQSAPASNNPPPAPRSNFAGKNLFGYGIQLDWTNKDRNGEMDQVTGMGFNWTKIQVRWCDMESGGKGSIDYNQTDNFVGVAANRGVKVLFSVVCAPSWSRSDGGAGGSGPPDDMQNAADFMGALAGKYCNSALGAIEVWNEHNLLTEWHGKPLSAPLYMDMLRRSYASIKAACPSIVVVSGAPTPTGWNDGVVATDDAVFLEQMYQNGLKDVSDAIGAHPSGFNVPALCNIMDPGCNRPEASFQAPYQSRHHSWGFLGTMTTYRNIMVKYGDGNKQIWPTEFGWPTHTGGQCGEGPCHPAGADNSAEQAGQWYVQAYQWAKQQGWVGVMIAWQLDFDRGELDAFRIAGKPAFGDLAAMPK